MIDSATALFSSFPFEEMEVLNSFSAKTGVVMPVDEEDYSEAHKKDKSAKNVGGIKISNIVFVLHYLVTGKIVGAESGKSIYGESNFSDSEKENCPFLLDDNQFVYSVIYTKSARQILSALILKALSSESAMSETKELFKQIVDEYNDKNAVDEMLILKFNDAFYYELKAANLLKLEESEVPDFLSFPKEAARTGNLKYIPALKNVLNKIKFQNIEMKEDTEKEEKEQKESETNLFEMCKNGDFSLDYPFENTTHIPSVSDLNSYIPCDSFYDLLLMIHHQLSIVQERMDAGEYGVNAIGNNYVNAILTGRPGTGKTQLANALAAALQMPIRVVSASRNTEEDEFQGKTKVAEGGFKFFETSFLDAYQHGGIILLEEFNLANPAVMMGALGQAIEKPFIIQKDGHEEIRRHPLCVVISTMNTGTQGSRIPSQALTSRSPNVFHMDDPKESEFIAILQKNGYGKKDCKRVYSVYQKITEYLLSSSVNAEDVALGITLRHCLAALLQMQIGIGFKRAIRNTMIGSISITDTKLASEVYEAVVEPLAG